MATFTAAPSLAGSPAPLALSGAGVDVTVRGNYLFNATSTGASSPAFVTVFDAVGNSATVPAFTYALDTALPVITPSPGWTNLPGGQPFYVDGNGTLWFSRWINGTASVDISINLVDIGSGLRSATASPARSLAGGPIYGSPTAFGPGTFGVGGWTVSYLFNTSSSDASNPVTITVCDNVANCATRTFSYRADNTPPSVSILSPATSSTVSGSIIVAARVSDAQSGPTIPQIELLGAGGTRWMNFTNMFWNGTAWIFPIQTALFADGSYRIVVEDFDRVGNVGAAAVDLMFLQIPKDTTPPTLVVSSPAAYAYVSGTVTFNVISADTDGGFGTSGGVWVQLGSYAPIALTRGPFAWSGTWDTTKVPDGTYTVTIWSTDAAGNTARTSFPLTVDNVPPAVAFLSPGSNMRASGIVDVRVSALDAVGLAYVNLTVGSSTVTMASLGNGVYGYPLDTTMLGTGAMTLTVAATDFGGHTTTKSVAVRVDNSPDVFGQVVGASPFLIFVVLLAALLVALLVLRRRKKPTAAPPGEREPPRAEGKKPDAPPPPEAGLPGTDEL
jgi:hypothetical protein